MPTPYPNLTGKALADGAKALAAETAFNAARDQTLVAATAGKIPFIVADGTNQMKYDFALQTALFCNTAGEVTAAQASTTTAPVYDVAGQVTYTYNGSAWVTDATKTPAKDFGTGRMILNPLSGKVFYIESEGELYLLNGVAMS